MDEEELKRYRRAISKERRKEEVVTMLNVMFWLAVALGGALIGAFLSAIRADALAVPLGLAWGVGAMSWWLRRM
jgi:fatty acid desaturase